MKKLIFGILFFALFALQTQAQVVGKPIGTSELPNFAPMLEFLASPLLEGRETGSKEAEIAAEYIASMMKKAGLEPYFSSNPALPGFDSYFQKFDLLKFSLEKAVVLATAFGNGQRPQMLNPFTDYTLINGYKSLNLESPVVFAGYGIESLKLNYNDYKNLDVKGKVVLILEGYPGETDTNSMAWQKFSMASKLDTYSLEQKCKDALKQGAAALMVISKDWIQAKKNEVSQNNAYDPEYSDAEYVLPSEKPEFSIPCFQLSKSGSGKLANSIGIDAQALAQDIAKKLTFKPQSDQNTIRISLKIKEENLNVSNVIGVLKGRDTSRMVILGAHYDHLGKRGNDIYFGADDNASGVAGLLALAESWSKNMAKPECNILFSSWTAEEKGLIGSRYFSSTLSHVDKVKLYINMDMISRSVEEDAKHNQLSIGTRSSDEYLKTMAKSFNSTLSKPFELDLWDVTGHSGSDYASFTAKNIPIMTYNSGLHNDYHTPRDQAQSVDFAKMHNVLALVNACLINYLNTLAAEK